MKCHYIFREMIISAILSFGGWLGGGCLSPITYECLSNHWPDVYIYPTFWKSSPTDFCYSNRLLPLIRGRAILLPLVAQLDKRGYVEEMSWNDPLVIDVETQSVGLHDLFAPYYEKGEKRYVVGVLVLMKSFFPVYRSPFFPYSRTLNGKDAWVVRTVRLKPSVYNSVYSVLMKELAQPTLCIHDGVGEDLGTALRNGRFLQSRRVFIPVEKKYGREVAPPESNNYSGVGGLEKGSLVTINVTDEGRRILRKLLAPDREPGDMPLDDDKTKKDATP